MKYNEEWYNSLVKPKFCPPAWVFAIVWVMLYILILIALTLVVLDGFNLRNVFAVFLFFTQIFINILWPSAFFKEHNLRKSFLLSALLTLLVFLTMLFFFNVSKLAGVLFLPYFLWCCFATVLNFEILELNEW